MADEEGKIFIGALSSVTTDDRLGRYFSTFGEVVESKVMMDKITGRSRGFGFVKFKDPSIINEVLKIPLHMLDNKQVDPKPCTPKHIQQQKKEAEIRHVQTHKIFVGGLGQDTEKEEVQQYFEKFGAVTEVAFVLSKEDNKCKGFGFVTFETESSVDEALKVHFHQISGKRVEAKRAQPREKLRASNTNQHAQSMGDYNNGHQNSNWSSGPGWSSNMYGGSMGGNMMGPSSQGYNMPSTGYGGYGSGYTSYPGYGYGGYGGPPPGGNYSQMGSYSQSNSSYTSMSANRSSWGDSKAYHPYKR